MSGIYIHIPFCRQACHYCDFHFSTSIINRREMVNALIKEIVLRNDYLPDRKIDTIYFGGGTPSLLSAAELMLIFDKLKELYNIIPNAEVTLEANPDDLTKEYIHQLSNTPVNRLSIGIQSFNDDDLRWMNRTHTSETAVQSVMNAAEEGFKNISIDLIYGLPNNSLAVWQENVKRAMSLPVTHLSCYCLTVEPRTTLAHHIKIGKSSAVDDDQSSEQFIWLMEFAAQHGYEHYEISNFCKPGHYSIHNTSYWQGLPYLGIGPSAHSYDGSSRQWNISNNPLYIKQDPEGPLLFTKEILSANDKFNEYVMISLRTSKGIDLNYLSEHFGSELSSNLLKEATPYIIDKSLEETIGHLQLTRQGKLIADRIASDLFI